MLCYVNQVHFTLKNKDRCLHVLPPCQSHDCGFPVPTRSRVPLNWAGDSGGLGCLHLLPAEEETGQREERWDKGEVKEGEARMVHIRWPVQETAHFYSDGGELGMGGGSSLHWAPDWLHHLFVQTAEQTSTDKHRLALAASRHLVLIWGYGTLVVCARLPLFCNTTYLLSAPPLMIMWMRG